MQQFPHAGVVGLECFSLQSQQHLCDFGKCYIEIATLSLDKSAASTNLQLFPLRVTYNQKVVFFFLGMYVSCSSL